MKKTKPSLLFIIFWGFTVPLLFIACGNNEPEEVLCRVMNAELLPLGELIENKSFFKITYNGDTAKCHCRTVFVMENDSLETILVSTLADKLKITIKTKPYNNPDWADLEKMKKSYDIKFDIIGLKKGVYKTEVHLNNVGMYKDDFVLE